MLVVLVGAILLYAGARYALNPVYVSDPQPELPPRYHELADRIDPNEADWQTLAALPALGEKRAKDLIAYRDRYRRDHPGRRAFARVEDLMRVKGFGRAIVATLAPFLTFPEPPSTAPAPTIPPES